MPCVKPQKILALEELIVIEVSQESFFVSSSFIGGTCFSIIFSHDSAGYLLKHLCPYFYVDIHSFENDNFF